VCVCGVCVCGVWGVCVVCVSLRYCCLYIYICMYAKVTYFADVCTAVGLQVVTAS